MMSSASYEDDNEIDLDVVEQDEQQVKQSISDHANASHSPKPVLCYDAEWLAILRKTHCLLSKQVTN